MQKIPVLNQEVFNVSWNNHLQFRTPSKGKVSEYLGKQADHNGIKEMDRYTITSNFGEYKVSDFISLENFVS
jgi:hypothetical protein